MVGIGVTPVAHADAVEDQDRDVSPGAGPIVGIDGVTGICDRPQAILLRAVHLAGAYRHGAVAVANLGLGLASRLWYQAGLWGEPAYEAIAK